MHLLVELHIVDVCVVEVRRLTIYLLLRDALQLQAVGSSKTSLLPAKLHGVTSWKKLIVEGCVVTQLNVIFYASTDEPVTRSMAYFWRLVFTELHVALHGFTELVLCSQLRFVPAYLFSDLVRPSFTSNWKRERTTNFFSVSVSCVCSLVYSNTSPALGHKSFHLYRCLYPVCLSSFKELG